MHHSKGKALIFHPVYSICSNPCVGGVIRAISLHIESPSYIMSLFIYIESFKKEFVIS